MRICSYSYNESVTYTVGIAGASGYAGGELLRLLEGHPELEAKVLAASSKAGAPLSSVHPHLPQHAGRSFDVTDHAALADCDLIFLALPHGESAALVGRLDPEVPIIDLGADFRLEDPGDWQSYYSGEHAGTWVYGLPELFRDQIPGHRRIANPGCYATAVALSLHPLLAAGLVEPADVVVVAASGTSGAGRGASESLMATEVMGSMSAYKVGGVHQHTPEMEQTLSTAGDRVTLSFTPLLAPMPRGILATCTARLAPGVGTQALNHALHGAYGSEPFITLLPPGTWPRTGSTLGGNSVQLQVAADQHSGRAVVVAALDNLVKGAAGQAIQNANIILGLDETLGLPTWGVAP